MPEHEVSNRMLLSALHGCRTLGIPIEAIERALAPRSCESLVPDGYISWDYYDGTLNRLAELLSAPHPLERATVACILNTHALAAQATICASATDLLHLVCGTRIQLAVPILGSRLDSLTTGQLYWAVRTPAQYPTSSCLRDVATGTVRGLVQLMGSTADPIHRVEFEEHEVRIWIDLGTIDNSTPPTSDGSAKSATWVGQSADAALLEVIRANQEEQEFGVRIGLMLGKCTGVNQGMDLLFSVLQDRCCTDWMRIDVALPRHQTFWQRANTRGPAEDAPIQHYEVTASGRAAFATLSVDSPQQRKGATHPLLTGLLPLLGDAILSWLSQAPEPDVPVVRDRQVNLASLPSRQRLVLEHLLGGRSNREIASHLNCSLRGVEGHVTRLLARFRVESRAELVAKLCNPNYSCGAVVEKVE